MCEDPRLRRRRRAPPLGELRVPLRKLVPNRARSFNVCLEKRRLVSGSAAVHGAGLRGRGLEGILGGECSATVTGLSALSDQEAQEPGHSPRHVPV